VPAVDRGGGLDELEFEWDPEKARANLRNHGVSFAEGATVFSDLLSRRRRSAVVDGETRSVLVGLSSLGRLLVVAFVDRGAIRIISTRRATPFERHAYQESDA
jgi:uncharacterized DUF497 family protein